MTFHIKFISIFVALVLTVALAYSTGAHFPFTEIGMKGETVDKASRSFPKPTAKKSAGLKKTKRDSTYSFFETLLDPKLKKHVGLEGKVEVFPYQESVTKKLPKPVTKFPSLGPFSGRNKQAVVRKSRIKNAIKKSENSKGNFSVDSFLVQAASFKNADHAQKLASKMRGKGYDAFMKKTERQRGDPWYRVYLGQFQEKGEALEIVHRARLSEKLDPILVLKRD